MGMGATVTSLLYTQEGLEFSKMFNERTTEIFDYYALYFSHQQFNKLVIKCGKERDGTEIGKHTVDKQKPDWILFNWLSYRLSETIY